MNSPHTKDKPQRVTIHHVEGRYPYHPRLLQSQNITTDVTELEDGTLRIFINDSLNLDAWISILATVNQPTLPHE